MIYRCKAIGHTRPAFWLRLPFRLGYVRLALRPRECPGRYTRAHEFEVCQNHYAFATSPEEAPFPKAGLRLTRRGSW